jgi:hypothetical protein
MAARFLPALVLFAATFVLLAGTFLPRRHFALARFARRLARRRWLAVTAVGLLGLANSAAIGPWKERAPRLHDEFSYLFAADTFASGRLTNPTPPLPEHFDNFHVILRPTFASKYPPMQGLALAVGQVLTGAPIAGVWLGMAAMCAACCWMLQAWLPARWALAGGLLLTIYPTVHFFGMENWSQMYWGGQMAAMVGALLYGGLRRVTTGGRGLVLLGVGLVVLANSRPFEGLLASVPAAVVLAVWWARRARRSGSEAVRAILPLAAVLAVAGLAMGYYNFRVTGDALRLPYQEHEATYAIAPLFFVLPPTPAPPTYFNADGTLNADWDVRYRFHVGYEQAWYDYCRERPWDVMEKKLDRQLFFYLVPVRLAPIGLLWLRRSRRTWLALAVCALVLAGGMIVWEDHPHYIAPIMAPVMFLLVQGLRAWAVARPLGRWVTWAGLLISAGLLATCLVSLGVGATAPDAPNSFHLYRPRLAAEMEALPGKHLVFVRYGPRHSDSCQWVFNRADLPNAKVVWARSLGPRDAGEGLSRRDRQLIDRLPGRTVWAMDEEEQPPVPRKVE